MKTLAIIVLVLVAALYAGTAAVERMQHAVAVQAARANV